MLIPFFHRVVYKNTEMSPNFTSRFWNIIEDTDAQIEYLRCFNVLSPHCVRKAKFNFLTHGKPHDERLSLPLFAFAGRKREKTVIQILIKSDRRFEIQGKWPLNFIHSIINIFRPWLIWDIKYLCKRNALPQEKERVNSKWYQSLNDDHWILMICNLT